MVDCTPEMRRVELQPGDFAIVLATDGLWDVLSDTEVVTVLQKVPPSSNYSLPSSYAMPEGCMISCDFASHEPGGLGGIAPSYTFACTEARYPARMATEVSQ